MSFEADDEILRDFLIEIGEILDQLSEQLVQLERCPNDDDLLDAIFQSFHSIKESAAFLHFSELVLCCHATEGVFDTLKKGQRAVDAKLMKLVFRSLDTLKAMFVSIREGETVTPADPVLMALLNLYARPTIIQDSVSVSIEPVKQSKPQETENLADCARDEVDDEFDQLLNLRSSTNAPNDPTSRSKQLRDSISDVELELLLVRLKNNNRQTNAPLPRRERDSIDVQPVSADEFESLLNELQSIEKSAENSTAEVPYSTVLSAIGLSNLSKTESDESPEISDEDFASVLDQLLGNQSENEASTDDSSVGGVLKPNSDTDMLKADSSEDQVITDEEFETLLDHLYGKGQFNINTLSSTISHEMQESNPTPKASSFIQPEIKSDGSAPEKTGSNPFIRVDSQRLDDMVNRVGELMLLRNRLVRIGGGIQSDDFHKTINALNSVISDLKTAILKTRMLPISSVFSRLPSVVAELARLLHKDVHLELLGGDTDVDKNLIDEIEEPLIHLIENAIDHGIETPDIREKIGKEKVGTITVSVEPKGEQLWLSVIDDGQGMDPNQFRLTAINMQRLNQEAADRLSDQECFNLAFIPGFSTKRTMSEVSGRGVGMGVVKTKIAQIKGSVLIESQPQVGTKIILKVPINLSIMQAMLVELHGQTFALPMFSVSETFSLHEAQASRMDEQDMILFREDLIPLYYLNRWLVNDQHNMTNSMVDSHVVVVSSGDKKIGLVVDQLIGQEEVVIKPLGPLLHNAAALSGTTITGDGKVALIIDIPSLLEENITQ